MPRVLLFERDPDLLGGATGAQAEAVHGYSVESRELPVGAWEGAYDEQHRGAYGLLLIEGLLARTVSIGDRRSVELVGPGDMLRPWVEDSETVLPLDVEWYVHQEATIAVLPESFPSDMAAWPRVLHVLADRMITRTRWLAVDLAIGHTTGVEGRILFMLWHLADRWGRVTADGVKVPLRLTHELMGDLVGARRPSVSTALGQLRRRRLVEPLEGGGWLLHGRPPRYPEDLGTGALE